jgi:predicted nucleic acid-binding protein
MFGISMSRRRLQYEGWLSRLINQSTLLVVDEVTAVEYAGIRRERKRAGRPIATNDMWIAALARAALYAGDYA